MLPLTSAAADDADPALASLRSFVARHCIDCHGPDLQEHGLRFDRLSNDLADPEAAQTWTRMLDKVAAGQMPPADAPRPPAKDAQAFTQELNRRLHDASLARQQSQGRVVLRRLNRIEHETTLRDLLGPQVNIRELLPEDGQAAGFDNVSPALDISSAHLLRYQEAAEAAVRSAIPSREPPRSTTRRTGRQIVAAYKTFGAYLDKSVRLVDDTLLMHVRTYDSVPCASAQAPTKGRYRVRASVYTVGTDRALPMEITRRGAYSGDGGDSRRVRDIPPGKTVEISEEFQLESRQIVALTGWDLPRSREFSARSDVTPLEKFQGPGLAVEWIELEGPLDDFPPAGYRRLFGDVPLRPRVSWNPATLEPASAQPREDAERLIRALLPVAFRRPVSESLAKYYVALAHARLDDGASLGEAMTVAYTAVFSSPHFLYLLETLRDDRPDRRTELDDYAVASRLSYFLWSSLPDAELFALASQGKLRQPAALRGQVERMLADPKAQRLTDNFAGQWLELRNINATTPDPEVYGEFDDFLFWSMPRETEAFFGEVLTRDLPVTSFVDSSWAFLNQRLAQHYGIDGVFGGELRRVELPRGTHRGGVLTQAAIMKVTANGSTTSPVLRGKWVLEHLVGIEPPPPPTNVPGIEPDVRGTTTIRQQLDKHRDLPACASCHAHIDPPGFALESFDPIGGWRDFYRGTRQTRVALANYPGRTVPRGLDVEPGGQTPDGREFHNIDDYKQILLADKDQLARNLAKKLLIYSTGADIQFADREVVEQLVADSRQAGYGFRSLLHAVVQSRVFLSK